MNHLIKTLTFLVAFCMLAVTTMAKAGDPFEPDNKSNAPIYLSPMGRTFAPKGDEDFARLPLQEGRHRIYTSELSPRADTFIELFADDGSLLASDDNSGVGVASEIVLDLDRAHTVLARIINRSDAYGETVQYTFSVESLVMPSPSPYPTYTPYPTATAPPEPTPSPYPTYTPYPTATALPEPTPSLYPTYTPYPTVTTLPEPTPSLYPTYTPYPTPLPQATDSARATASPQATYPSYQTPTPYQPTATARPFYPTPSPNWYATQQASTPTPTATPNWYATQQAIPPTATAQAPRPSSQSFPNATATPDSEGVIYATVRAGDTLTAIALRHGLSLTELRELNEMQGDMIRVGERLIVGYADAPLRDETETAVSTETPDTNPLAKIVDGAIQPLLLYIDLNGDSQPSANEMIDGLPVTITDLSGLTQFEDVIEQGYADLVIPKDASQMLVDIGYLNQSQIVKIGRTIEPILIAVPAPVLPLVLP